MMAVITLLVCVVIMVFFNAVMDATENEPNFNESIFRNLARRFWLKEVSWQYAKKIFGYKLDAWHIAKSGMVVFFALALVAAVIAGKNLSVQLSIWDYLLFITGIGLLWNGCFRLFYHIIFKVK